MPKFWDYIHDDSGGRVLRLEGPIDSESFWGDEITPQDFRDELYAEDGDLTLWINSPGGNVFAAAEIYTMIRDYPHNVTVRIASIAASAASVIAMAGNTVQMSPTALLMIHDPSTIAFGNTKDMNAAPADIEKLNGAITTCDGTSLSMAETMQDNLGGQLTILKSQLEELAIAFGEILMPTIRKIVSHIQALLDKFNSLSPATKETIAKVALVAAALGPLLVVVGKTMVGVGKLMQVVSKLPMMLASAKTALTSFGAAIGGISAPVVAVIAVIAALVAAFVHLWKTNEDFRNKMTAIWNEIKSIFEGFCQGIVDRINALGFDFKNIGEVIKAVWEGLVYAGARTAAAQGFDRTLPD